MSKTILLTKGDTEVVIGRLEKEDIQKYEQNDFRDEALEQGFCYVVSTVKPSSLQYFLSADEAIDWILQIK